MFAAIFWFAIGYTFKHFQAPLLNLMKRAEKKAEEKINQSLKP